MELVCKIQNYEWGKKGSCSKVAILYKNANEDFTINDNVPYAELWMGTHVSGPSMLKDCGEFLGSVIARNPELLGKEVAAAFNNELPFLFKVLSINKALSIQAHPSKQHAEQLYAKSPNIYKDPNHKPELAVALTSFEALCGFRCINEIRSFAKDIPELANLIHCQKEDDTAFLRESFKSVLTCNKDVMKTIIDDLLERFGKCSESDRGKYLAELVERLHSQFPYDNGILMIYFLNYLKLEPSEAIYLGANEPHAYISGDCIEVMACSDNVVRAGLTPKFIDVDTLCSMLIYKGGKPEEKIFQPVQEDDYSHIYKPPVKDFAVVEIRVPINIKQYTTIIRNSASIIIVISGSGSSNTLSLKPGRTLFLAAGESLGINEITEDLVIYQAMANVF